MRVEKLNGTLETNMLGVGKKKHKVKMHTTDTFYTEEERKQIFDSHF